MKNFNIKNFLIRYYQYFIVGIIFIILVVVLSILSSQRKGGDTAKGKDKDKTESSSEAPGSVEVPDVKLEKDAYDNVNSLVEKYFTAMANGDTDTLIGLCPQLDEKEQIRIRMKSEYTEDYQNLVCYTKPGPDENSYIVFAYYEIKFKNIDTLAPGLTSLYLKTDDNGELYVYDGELSEGVREYIREIAAQDDVVDLLNTVDANYSEAADSDDTLKSFMEALPTVLDDAVSSELAAKEDKQEAQSDGDDAAAVSTKAKVKETINVRKSASTEGDKLGKLMGGDSVTVVKTLDNGWAQIDYQGQEAYVKTEYLEMESAAPAESQPADAQNTGDSQPAQQETQAPETTQSSGGKVEVKESVRIRSAASVDSEQLGSAYKGDKFELLGQEGDWCKIKFEGKTAYIKTEFVDIIK